MTYNVFGGTLNLAQFQFYQKFAGLFVGRAVYELNIL